MREVSNAVALPIVKQTIQLVIIDEHPAVSKALVARLAKAPGLEVVASASSFERGLQKVRHFAPAIVLLELKGRSQYGLDPVGAISRAVSGRPVGVIVLTSYPDKFERAVALQAGAQRYLLKDIDSERLIAEIEEVAAVVQEQLSA